MSDGALVWIDGDVRASGAAAWVDTDRSSLYGDGLFETVLVRGGAPLWLAEHLERFQRSARALAYPDIDLANEAVTADEQITRLLALTSPHYP